MPIVNGAGSSGGGSLTVYDFVTQATDLTVSATSAATAQAFFTGNSVAYDGSSRVLLEWYSPSVGGSAGVLIAEFYDGATDLNLRIGQIQASANGAPGYGACTLTPSAGAHAYSVKFWRTVANVTVAGNSAGVYTTAFMRVTKS